ncbi:uncharacterized protein LOC144439856 [Glandiceps talaboti]
MRGKSELRYDATSDGWLVINNLRQSDEGTYKCVVVFKLITPIDGNGYHTETDVVQLMVIADRKGLVVYPKRRSDDDERPTVICEAFNSKPDTVLDWDFGMEDIQPNYIIRNSRQDVGNGLSHVISHLIIDVPRNTDFYELTVTCSAVEERKQLHVKKSVLIYLDQVKDNGKRCTCRGKQDRSRTKDKKRRVRKKPRRSRRQRKKSKS